MNFNLQEKITIKNRNSKKIVLILEKVENSRGLAFVMHGLGGFKEQKHVETFAKAFLESGYNVVRFDTCDTFGESEGDYEIATTTSYYEDLIDVIKWSKNQEWYIEPFVLVGHSLGAISVALYAEENPNEVKGLAPISTVISKRLHHEAIPKEKLEEYERTGYKIGKSNSLSGVIKKLKWHPFSEDLEKYNLLENVDKLKMPVLLIVGEKDSGTPPEHQKILYDKLPGEKEIHIIKGALHTFREKEHLEEIKKIFKEWIAKL